MIKSVTCAALAAIIACPAFAYDVDVANLKIKSVAVIGVAFGGHQAGNLEVEIDAEAGNDLAYAPGLSCTDRRYLTTLASTQPDGQLFKKLLSDWRLRRVTVTDEPALTAFPGRCSIKAIALP